MKRLVLYQTSSACAVVGALLWMALPHIQFSSNSSTPFYLHNGPNPVLHDSLSGALTLLYVLPLVGLYLRQQSRLGQTGIVLAILGIIAGAFETSSLVIGPSSSLLLLLPWNYLEIVVHVVKWPALLVHPIDLLSPLLFGLIISPLLFISGVLMSSYAALQQRISFDWNLLPLLLVLWMVILAFITEYLFFPYAFSHQNTYPYETMFIMVFPIGVLWASLSLPLFFPANRERNVLHSVSSDDAENEPFQQGSIQSDDNIDFTISHTEK